MDYVDVLVHDNPLPATLGTYAAGLFALILIAAAAVSVTPGIFFDGVAPRAIAATVLLAMSAAFMWGAYTLHGVADANRAARAALGQQLAAAWPLDEADTTPAALAEKVARLSGDATWYGDSVAGVVHTYTKYTGGQAVECVYRAAGVPGADTRHIRLRLVCDGKVIAPNHPAN